MIDLLLSAIGFALLLGVLVFIHELGHFLTAKKFGVYCGEFAIGMGPVIWKKQGKETQYSLRLLPLGGFVSMAGEADDTKKDAQVPFSRTINGIAWYKRIIIMLAGIFMNVLLAWIVFVGITMYQGVVVDASGAQLSSVQENSIAQEAGFEAGDILLEMRGEDGRVFIIDEPSVISEAVNLYPQSYTYQVQREDEVVEVVAEAVLDEESNARLLGFSITNKYKEIAWYEAFAYGTQETIDSATLIFKTLATLVQGENLSQLSGPIGIFDVAGDAFQAGLLPFFSLLAILSINLAVMNALPLPILDGGRAIITILERIFKRSMPEKILNIVMYASVFLLIGLMVYATFNDVLRLF